MSKEPFTEKEQKVMDLIINTHNGYVILENNERDMSQWVDAIHTLQYLLARRVLRRDYPKTFGST